MLREREEALGTYVLCGHRIWAPLQQDKYQRS